MYKDNILELLQKFRAKLSLRSLMKCKMLFVSAEKSSKSTVLEVLLAKKVRSKIYDCAKGSDKFFHLFMQSQKLGQWLLKMYLGQVRPNLVVTMKGTEFKWRICLTIKIDSHSRCLPRECRKGLHEGAT